MKVIIAGGRKFTDYQLLRDSCNALLKNINVQEIVSGGGTGADKLGEKYALECGIGIKTFKANWSLGRGAGHKRNEQMAKYADYLIAFWDGNSSGTKSMIDYAKKQNLKIDVIRIKS